MLWNSIYEFFVLYVFGGYIADGEPVGGLLGAILDTSDNTFYEINTSSIFIFNGSYGDQGGVLYPFTMSLGNYLSLIATIITLVAILLFCVFIIKKIIGVMFRLFTFGA